MTDKTDHAETQARAQVDSIVQMVAALECDYERLEELREERDDSAFLSRVLILRANPDAALNEVSDWWEDHNPSDADELAELEEAAGDCEDEDEARARIQEDALSCEVRSGWQSVGEELTPDEFRIVLCTGGPHVEIRGDLDHHGEPSRVRICYSDWGTSGELFDFDHDAVMTYAREFFPGC